MPAVPVPMGSTRMLVRTLVVGAFWLLAGCASVQNGDPRDPYESWNREVFNFNEGFDEAIAKPIATAYRDLLPFEIRVRVRNFFSNIQDLMIGVNNLLQGKPAEAWSDWTRFVINSSVGLFGLHDVASEAGLEKHNEDFGQTFAVWGAEEGPYLVWPFVGAGTVRDSFGFAADVAAAPTRWLTSDAAVQWGLWGLYLVNERAELLDAKTILDESAIDRYVARRDFYYQRRHDLIFDGAPPRAPRERPPVRDEPRAEALPAPNAPDARTDAPSAWAAHIVSGAASLDDSPFAPSGDAL
jgi:phospholipid-binding lipoprotein MlaA